MFTFVKSVINISWLVTDWLPIKRVEDCFSNIYFVLKTGLNLGAKVNGKSYESTLLGSILCKSSIPTTDAGKNFTMCLKNSLKPCGFPDKRKFIDAVVTETLYFKQISLSPVMSEFLMIDKNFNF